MTATREQARQQWHATKVAMEAYMSTHGILTEEEEAEYHDIHRAATTAAIALADANRTTGLPWWAEAV